MVRVVTNDPEWQLICPKCDLLLEYDAEDRIPTLFGGASVACPCCDALIPEREDRDPGPAFSVAESSDDGDHCLSIACALGRVMVKYSESNGISVDIYDLAAGSDAVASAWAALSDLNGGGD
jgi:hypothetical protein